MSNPTNTMQEIDEIVHDVFLAGWNDKLLDNNHPMYKSQEQQAKAEAKQRLSNLLIEARIKEARYVENYYDGEEFHQAEWQNRIAQLKSQLTNTEGDKKL